MVQPQNIGSAVEEFLSLLHLDPHQEFVLEQNDPGISPPSLTHIPQFVIIFSEFFMCRLLILQTNTDSFIFLPDVPLPSSLPSPCTIYHLASHYLDIQSVPRRSFFAFLCHFTTSDLEREKLEEFTSPEGQVGGLNTRTLQLVFVC